MALSFEVFKGTILNIDEKFGKFHFSNERKINEIAKKHGVKSNVDMDDDSDYYLVIKDEAGEIFDDCIYSYSFYDLSGLSIEDNLEERCISFIKELNEVFELEISLDIEKPYICAKIIPNI